MNLARPDFDPELRLLLGRTPPAPRLTPEPVDRMRRVPPTPVDDRARGRAIDRREASVPTPDGARVPLSIFSPAGTSRGSGAPCVYWIHGGGMVAGDRFMDIGIPLEWLDRFGAVVASVGYRLAPEVGGMTLVEDCYRGLLWVVEHAEELGVDPARVIVAGIGAGGGLAAGTALLARDLGAPAIAGQMLLCPMLDHRNDTTSARRFSGVPMTWTREANEYCWRAVIGDLRDDEVPGYVSPANARDLAGLPTAYIDVWSAEVFRDEDVAYASRIWAAGGQAELHVWAGGRHGFDALFPHPRISAAARRARAGWLDRVLNPIADAVAASAETRDEAVRLPA